MENNLPIQENTQIIDSMELLTRFLIKCKEELQRDEEKVLVINCSADLVTAVYYYRKYPDVNEFINKYLKNSNNYFHIQWVRATWITFSKMSPEEISNLVINQISAVADSEECE